MHRQHVHRERERVSSNLSLKESSHSLSLCSKAQFSSAGLQRAYSNINYIYHFLMRPLKNIYPHCMSARSEMSWGMSLLRVWTCRHINKHSNTLKGTRWCKLCTDTWLVPWCSPLGSSSSAAVDISAPMGVYAYLLPSCIYECLVVAVELFILLRGSFYIGGRWNEFNLDD